MPVSTDTGVGRIDELLILLAHARESEAARLAGEHLQTARTYLLGAMDVEYNLNLELARQAVAEIPDHDVRDKAERTLATLIEDSSP